MSRMPSTESSFETAIRVPPMREPPPKIPNELISPEVSARGANPVLLDLALLKENQMLKDEIEKLRKALAAKSHNKENDIASKEESFAMSRRNDVAIYESPMRKDDDIQTQSDFPLQPKRV